MRRTVFVKGMCQAFCQFLFSGIIIIFFSKAQGYNNDIADSFTRKLFIRICCFYGHYFSRICGYTSSQPSKQAFLFCQEKCILNRLLCINITTK